jgi:hypothetical protein
MAMRALVVDHSFPIHFERQCSDLLIRRRSATPDIENLAAGRLLRARFRSLPQTLLNGIQCRICEAVAAHAPRIEHAERRDRLEALVDLRRRQRISAATADAEQAEALGIDAGILGDEVGRAMDILGAVLGLVGVARLAAARALIRRVHRDRDIALFREALRKEAGDLFLHAAVRVRDDNSGIFLVRIVVRRGVDVGGDIQSVKLVFVRVDIDLARHVLGDSAVIDQRERILLVVRCDSRGSGHCMDS